MKKLLNVLFVMVFAFTLVSCGGTTGGSGTGNGGNNSGDQIVVKFWHANGQAIQQTIQQMIDSFEAEHPNVTVEQTSAGNYDQLLSNVKDYIQTGDIPAIVQTYPDHVSAYLHSQSVVDLNEYIYDEEVGFDALGIDPSVYVPNFYAEGSLYGSDAMYSLPLNKSTEVVYYNQDIFAKYDWFVTVLGLNSSDVYSKYAPVAYDAEGNINADEREIKDDFIWNPTWQDFEKIGAAFKTTAEYAAKIAEGKMASGFGYDSEDNLFITLTQQFAALDENEAYGPRGEQAYTRFGSTGDLVNGEFTFLNADNKYARQAVQYFKDQVDLSHFATSGILGANYCSDAFKDGQIVITCGSSAGATYNNGSTFKTGVATYPQLEGTPEDKYQVIQQGTNITLLDQVDDEVEKYAWLFMLHMINFENSLKFSTSTSYFPIRTDVYESQKYQDFVLGIERNADGEANKDENGDIIYNPSLSGLAAKAGWMQRNWFYTNVTFLGTDQARTEVENLVKAVLLGTSNINDAFAKAKENLTLYLPDEQK